MLARPSTLALLGLLALVACHPAGGSRAAESQPSSARAGEGRAPASSLIIGRVSEAGALVVESVVLGEAPREPRVRVDEGGPSLAIPRDLRLVLAFDAEGRLEAFGRLLAGPSLEQGALLVRASVGIPTPEVMTLDSLREHRRTGELAQRYALELGFYDEDGARSSSALGYELVREGGRERFEGPPGVAPVAAMRVDGSGRIGLSLDLDLPAGSEELAGRRVVDFDGRARGVREDGAVVLELVATHPLIGERDYLAMLADPSLELGPTTVTLDVEPDERWRWSFPGLLIDGAGVEHPRAESGGEIEALDGERARVRWRYAFAGGVELELVAVVADAEWPSPLLALVRAGRVRCKLVAGGSSRACTLGDVDVELSRGE